MKKIYESFKTGVFIGVVLSLFFSYIGGEGNFLMYTPAFEKIFSSKIEATASAVILYGIIGVLSYVASIIFNKIDNLLYATIFHWIVMNIIILVVGYILKWFDNIFIAIIMISIIYFVIYLVNFINHKIKINNINNKINSLK